MGAVRCVDCGFLTKRYENAGSEHAKSWAIPKPSGSLPAVLNITDRQAIRDGTVATPYYLTCHLGIDNFRDGRVRAYIASFDDRGPQPDRDYDRTILANVVRERTCEGFVPYRHGCTPQQHFEMREAERVRVGGRRWDVWKMVLDNVNKGLIFALGMAFTYVLSNWWGWLDMLQALLKGP